jgi:hypothetical protein
VNTNPDVDAWFEDFEHPLLDAMQLVRQIVLSDDRMTETIKWKSPTFMYKGNMASINPRAKAHVSLMFHSGAAIPGTHPRMKGDGDTARYVKFADIEDVKSARAELLAIVAAWCQSRE